MAKKTTFILVLILSLMLVASFSFVSCSQDAGGGGSNKPSTPTVKEEPKDNLVYNGYFEKGDDTDIVKDGSTILIVDGVGFGGSKCMSVDQTEDYGQVYVDLTSEYAKGRNFYVEASFKNNGSTKDIWLEGRLSFTVVSGAVQAAVGTEKGVSLNGDAWEEYYDCDDIYEGDWATAAEAAELGCTVQDEGDLEDGGWVTISAVLTSETIEKLLADTTAKYGAVGETPTIQYLLFGFYVGDYNNGGQDGYKYYLDNVYIKNLNPEIPKQGRTYVPASVDDGGDEEEEEEEL